MSNYQVYIGLEIHIQLKTQSKIFCSCKNHFGDKPNSNICPVCMGLPGALPALNSEAILRAYALAKMLNCQLAKESLFERKNYFYPDLPKNYQISQFDKALGTMGYIDIDLQGKDRRIRIRECHLEEDAGKMIHAGDMSFLDFNRTGVPLLEIVTEPDIANPEEAEELVLELRRIVRYMELSDGNMEEGSLRADANISINPKNKGLGKKVEVKNLNSSRFIRKSLSYEIQRQSALLNAGKDILQETRLWNENRDQTEGMRTKEQSFDYRYFPEPDLLPFIMNKGFAQEFEKFRVALPFARRKHYKESLGLSDAQARFLSEERAIADYFEGCIELAANPLELARWMTSDVQKELRLANTSLLESPLSPRRLVSLLELLQKGQIHGKITKQVLRAIIQEDKDPEQIIREKNWEQISDPKEIQELIEEVLQANPQAVSEFGSGKDRVISFLMGQIMKRSSGRMHPQITRDSLENSLSLLNIATKD